MRTIEVNFSHEPARYHALMDAMISQDEIEGGYVMFCVESRDQGQRIGKFELREPGYEPPRLGA